VLQPARAPETGPASSLPATYGELIDTAELHVATATAPATTAAIDLRAVHAQLLGYQRFLRAAGDLLALLTHLNGRRPPGLCRLADLLTAVPRRDTTATAWTRAATTLGAAHDLLATHLGPDREIRSPDALAITSDTGTALALRQVGLLLLNGATATDRLTYTARTAQVRCPEKPIPQGLSHALTVTNRTILLHAKAALWDLDQELAAPPSSNLAQIRAAVTRLPLAATTDGFESSLAALRALRELSFRQARGRSPASPASVRDLTLLAAALTHPDLDWLPAPATGLERLRHAHASDQLAAAHAAWHLAGQDLTDTIRGTTKAPRTYEAAIGRLLDDAASLSPPVRLAVTTALPRLGHDAGRTIGRLHALNALVNPGPVGIAGPRLVWRPLEHLRAQELIDRFTAAADATAPAAVSLRQLITNPDRHHSTVPPGSQVPRPTRGLHPAVGLPR